MNYILHEQDRFHIRIQSNTSCLRRNLFHKFCLQRIFSIKKYCLLRILFHKNPLLYARFLWNQMLLWFFAHSGENRSTLGRPTVNQSIINVLPVTLFDSQKILPVGQFISVSYLVYRFIGVENDRIQILSDHNDTTCTKQQWKKCQTTNSTDIQIPQHQFNSKTVYKKQRTSSHVT